MAQRRMISKSISTSKKLSALSTFEALLFTWTIPHCDDFGRMDGNAKIVKGIVMPLRDETVEDVESALKILAKKHLIERYTVDEEDYIEVIKWDDHQTFKTDRNRVAKYPSNPESSALETTGNQMEKTSAEVKIREVKLSEDKLREGFEVFWLQYPNKVSKKKAFESWKKIAPDEALLNKILQALTLAVNSPQWKKDNGQYVPHPTTWLNQERWNDEIKTAKPKVVSKFDNVKSKSI